MIYALTLEAIQQSRTGESLDAISRALWTQEHPLTDDQTQTLAETIQARRIILRGEGPRKIPKLVKPRAPRNQRKSLLRRRQLAASGMMPPIMASNFTTAELAALKIVADEIRTKRVCGLVLDAIAARAGVSKKTVQNALREAARLGYLTIRHRRPIGQLKNLPNLITIIDPRWLGWLKVARLSTLQVQINKTSSKRTDACPSSARQPPMRSGFLYEISSTIPPSSHSTSTRERHKITSSTSMGLIQTTCA